MISTTSWRMFRSHCHNRSTASYPSPAGCIVLSHSYSVVQSEMKLRCDIEITTFGPNWFDVPSIQMTRFLLLPPFSHLGQSGCRRIEGGILGSLHENERLRGQRRSPWMTTYGEFCSTGGVMTKWIWEVRILCVHLFCCHLLKNLAGEHRIGQFFKPLGTTTWTLYVSCGRRGFDFNGPTEVQRWRLFLSQLPRCRTINARNTAKGLRQPSCADSSQRCRLPRHFQVSWLRFPHKHDSDLKNWLTYELYTKSHGSYNTKTSI